MRAASQSASPRSLSPMMTTSSAGAPTTLSTHQSSLGAHLDDDKRAARRSAEKRADEEKSRLQMSTAAGSADTLLFAFGSVSSPHIESARHEPLGSHALGKGEVSAVDTLTSSFAAGSSPSTWADFRLPYTSNDAAPARGVTGGNGAASSHTTSGHGCDGRHPSMSTREPSRRNEASRSPRTISQLERHLFKNSRMSALDQSATNALAVKRGIWW